MQTPYCSKRLLITTEIEWLLYSIHHRHRKFRSGISPYKHKSHKSTHSDNRTHKTKSEPGTYEGCSKGLQHDIVSHNSGTPYLVTFQQSPLTFCKAQITLQKNSCSWCSSQLFAVHITLSSSVYYVFLSVPSYQETNRKHQVSNYSVTCQHRHGNRRSSCSSKNYWGSKQYILLPHFFL